MQKMGEYDSPCNWYDDQVSFMSELDSPRRVSHSFASYNHHYTCKQEPELQYHTAHHDAFLQLPQLESPKIPHSAATSVCSIVPYGFDMNAGSAMQSSNITQEEHMQQFHQQNMSSSLFCCNNVEQAMDQVTDWRVLDKFVASQLSHDQDSSKETSYSNAVVFNVAAHMNMLSNDSKTTEEYA